MERSQNFSLYCGNRIYLVHYFFQSMNLSIRKSAYVLLPSIRMNYSSIVTEARARLCCNRIRSSKNFVSFSVNFGARIRNERFVELVQGFHDINCLRGYSAVRFVQVRAFVCAKIQKRPKVPCQHIFTGRMTERSTLKIQFCQKTSIS